MSKLFFIFFSCGEVFGDLYVLEFLSELLWWFLGLKFFGFGGICCVVVGGEFVVLFDEVLVMGFVEVVSKFFGFRWAMGCLCVVVERCWLDVVVFVDFFGFNFRFVKWFEVFGILIFYYVSL